MTSLYSPETASYPQSLRVAWTTMVQPCPSGVTDPACTMAAPDTPTTGTFELPAGRWTVVVHGWKNPDASPPTLDIRNSLPFSSADALANDAGNDVAAVPGYDCPLPTSAISCLQASWVPFSHELPIISAGAPTTFAISFSGGHLNVLESLTVVYPTAMFENITYSPDFARPTSRVVNAPATVVSSSESVLATAPSSGSVAGPIGSNFNAAPHQSNAAVIAAAVLCPVLGVAALTFGTLWWLQRRRRMAPSAAYRDNPETAWVPIDEKRQPTPGPSN